MVRLSASGRIGQQVGAKPSSPTQTVAPTQSTTLTQEQQAKLQQDFYSKRSTGQLSKIDLEKNKAQEQVKYYESLATKARNENRDATKYENKSDRYSDIIKELDSIKQRASTGKYNVNDLINYAKDKASYQSERRVFRRKLKQSPPTYDFSKVKQGEITYIKEFDTYYTRDPTGRLQVTSGERGNKAFEQEITTGGSFDFSQRSIKPDAPIRVVEQKIESRPIITGPTETTREDFKIDIARPEDFSFGVGLRRNVFDATGSFITETIPETVSHGGQILGGLALGDTSYWKRYDPTRVFKDVGSKGGEAPVSIPQFGTVSSFAPTGFQNTTGFELLKEERIKRGVPIELSEAPVSLIAEGISNKIEDKVINKYQGKVDTGELTVEEATVKAKKEFSTQFKKETSKLNGLEVGSLLKRGGEKISSNIKTAAVIGGLTALGLTPTGAVVGGGIEIATGGFFATKGSEKIKAGKFQEGILDVGTGALFATTGFAGIGGSLGRIESQAVKKELTKHVASKIKRKGDIIINKDTGIALLKAEQKSGDLITEYEIFGKIIRKNDKVSFIPEGKVSAKTFGKLDTNIQREFLGEGGSKVLGGQTFDFGTTAIQIGKIDEHLATFSRTVVKPQSRLGLIYSARDVPKTSLFGERELLKKRVAVSKELPDILRLGRVEKKIGKFEKKLSRTATLGGEDKVSFLLSATKKIGKGKEGEEFFATTSKKLGIKDGKLIGSGEDFGIVRQITTSKDLGLTGLEKGDSGIKKIFSGLPIEKRTPMSKTFGVSQKQILKTSVKETKQISKTTPFVAQDLSAVSEEVGKSLTGMVTKPKTVPMSAYTGTGLYEVSTSGMFPSRVSPRGRTTFFDESTQRGETVQSNPSLMFKVKQDVSNIQAISPRVKTRLATSTSQKKRSLLISKTIQDTSLVSRTDQAVKVASILKSKTTQRLVPKTMLPSIVPGLGITPIVPTTPFSIRGGIYIPFPKSSPVQVVKKKQGYIPQAKTKGGKWVSLSKKPLTRETALSRGSRAVDQTLSAQFRVKKVGGKVVNGVDNYFSVTRRKYRPYKIKKGQKIELHNRFIEKAGSRIDTRGEVAGLSLAKFAKQKGWTSTKKKKKKGKK